MNASDLETNNANPGMATPASGSVFDSVAAEVLSLQHDLRSQENRKGEFTQQLTAIESIYARCCSVAETSIPLLISSSTTAPAAARQFTRHLQSLLDSLTAAFLRLLADAPIDNDTPSNFRKRILLGVLDTTAQRILAASLTSSHAAKGLWRQLHQTHVSIRNDTSPRDNPVVQEPSPDTIYVSTVLLGYALSAGFSPAEIAFLHSYFRRQSSAIDIGMQASAPDTGCLWTSPESDMPARSCARTPPPSGITVQYLSGRGLAGLIRQQLARLETGTPPGEMELPDFADTPAGKSILRRTANLLDTHMKRRFPRRRQNYRGEMCFGIDNVHQAFSAPAGHVPSSRWMITNESPDGYAAMHISGKTATVLAGDIAALRIEGTGNWQLCMIRWKHSANPEHLELGLQILATHIIPARVAASGSCNEHAIQEAALYLPPTPSVQEYEALVLPCGTPVATGNTLILIIERDNISVRDIRIGQRDEQTARVEVFRIGPA